MPHLLTKEPQASAHRLAGVGGGGGGGETARAKCASLQVTTSQSKEAHGDLLQRHQLVNKT